MNEACDTMQIEPRIEELLERKLLRRDHPAYRVVDEAAVRSKLQALLTARGFGDASFISAIRLAGGASKEQFLVEVDLGVGPERLVLRMDPDEGVVETCRFREADVIAAMSGCVPVPAIRLLDGDGQWLGRPGLVTSFVSGVTKPPGQSKVVVSGVGTSFDRQWRDRLAPSFVENLGRMHAFDWRNADIGHYAAPRPGTIEAACWQVNWWSRVWRDDHLVDYPLIGVGERWLRDNLPVCDDPVMVHGDYRTGNFMFDAQTAEITAILDWELAHIGDFHEDLGWTVQRLFADVTKNGETLVCGLLTREDFLARYEQATGRTVDRTILHFYEVLGAYKCATQLLASSLSAADRQHNHQDLLLAWLVPLGHTFLSDMARLILEGEGK